MALKCPFLWASCWSMLPPSQPWGWNVHGLQHSTVKPGRSHKQDFTKSQDSGREATQGAPASAYCTRPGSLLFPEGSLCPHTPVSQSPASEAASCSSGWSQTWLTGLWGAALPFVTLQGSFSRTVVGGESHSIRKHSEWPPS